jgi:hypothetical protein
MPNRLAAVLHPVWAWREYVAAVDAEADAEAVAVGLTVEDLGHGVRRYRDPALDHLADHRTHRAADPYAEVRNDDGKPAQAEAVEPVEARAWSWSTPTLTLAGWSR